VISNICKGVRANQKELWRKGGIELIKDNLSYHASSSNWIDKSGNVTSFILALLDCLNNSVFGNWRSEIHFIEIEGVYVLLDLLEESDICL